LTKCSLHLTALCVVKKTTDCRIFSCQKTQKLVVRLRDSRRFGATASDVPGLAEP